MATCLMTMTTQGSLLFFRPKKYPASSGVFNLSHTYNLMLSLQVMLQPRTTGSLLASVRMGAFLGKEDAESLGLQKGHSSQHQIPGES